MVQGSRHESQGLFPYIKNLEMKRFTEAFYMTYRNMHPTERIPARDGASVEERLKPIFDSIGFDQSIYLP